MRNPLVVYKWGIWVYSFPPSLLPCFRRIYAKLRCDNTAKS